MREVSLAPSSYSHAMDLLATFDYVKPLYQPERMTITADPVCVTERMRVELHGLRDDVTDAAYRLSCEDINYLPEPVAATEAVVAAAYAASRHAKYRTLDAATTAVTRWVHTKPRKRQKTLVVCDVDGVYSKHLRHAHPEHPALARDYTPDTGIRDVVSGVWTALAHFPDTHGLPDLEHRDHAAPSESGPSGFASHSQEGATTQ